MFTTRLLFSPDHQGDEIDLGQPISDADPADAPELDPRGYVDLGAPFTYDDDE